MTDFTVTITDQAMLDAINWAMARDNAYPGRATPIASAQDYVQIEVLALFSQLPAQKQQSDIAAAVAAAQAGDPSLAISLANEAVATARAAQLASPAQITPISP